MEILRLTREDKPKAVHVLAESFRDYPVMRYVLRDSGVMYESHLKSLVGSFCEIRLTQGWPLLGLTEDNLIKAVAGINEPGKMPYEEKFNLAFDKLKNEIGKGAYQRLDNFEAACALLEPSTPHYFLGIIGVLPECQGMGFAQKLIDEVKSMSKKHTESQGVALSTENPRNIPYYQKHSFQVTGESDVEELHTWLMYWENS